MNEEEKKKFNIFLKVISLSILAPALISSGVCVAIFDYINETVLISSFIDKFVLFLGGVLAGSHIYLDKIPNLLKEVDYYERPVNNNSSKEEEKLERNLEEDLGKTITLEELVGLEEPIPDVDLANFNLDDEPCTPTSPIKRGTKLTLEEIKDLTDEEFDNLFTAYPVEGIKGRNNSQTLKRTR